jgi:hypothetical protein
VPGAPLVPADAAAQDGWLALRAGRAALACTVVQISGVSCPVAIAVLTGDAGPAEERPAEPTRRQRRAGGTKTAARKAGTRRHNAATSTRRGRPGSDPG